MTVNRTRCLLFAGEVAIVVVMIVALLLIRFVMPTFHRGFFCDDESLMHPYHASTVPYWAVMVVGIGINLGAIALLVPLITRRQLPAGSRLSGHALLDYFLLMWPCVLAFVVGLLATYILTEVPKKMVGRFRPHFLTLCEPQFTGVCSPTRGYIQNFTCGGSASAEQMREVRKSFPSGHTSSAFYLAVSFMILLQMWMRYRAVLVLRAFLQTLVFVLALYVGLSRISDYKHHWSDVLAGAVVGTGVAVVTS